MTTLNKLYKLSRQIALSLVKEEDPKELKETDLFEQKYKDYIFENINSPEKRRQRQLLAQQINKKRAWKNVQKAIGVAKPPIWRYAAVAVIVLGTVFYFAQYNSAGKIETTVATGKPSIAPGTDKATLVLGNGQTIVLGNGNTYKGNGVAANDKSVTYSDNNASIEYNYLTIPRAGQFSLLLADGTRVRLNSETQLKFPNHFIDGKPRFVELVYGEAYFEVSPSTVHKGSRFNVKTKGQNVEVLGTQFNIKAYKDEENLITTLKEGKVVIDYGTKKEELSPGEQSVIHSATSSLRITPANLDRELAWLNGQFVFDNLTLKDIVKVLSRWYDVEFIIKEETIKNEKFKGQFSKNQNLEVILELIKTTNQIKSYEIKEKTVIFK
ncbi:FecR family protein [Flavobacterium phragmitis]|uniref:FecR family protein n=1 Tax=Flavobacterium phragmitis TaxID=739143 RepID=A0A1I1XQH5_9FLAO|nr:FecR family protein [Flavobacterium phragmitis]SFE07993.1 FecR family protein [Flavobacterium phragmitis]